MVWTQEEEHEYLKSHMKKYSIGIPYMVWVDVDAKDESEAIDMACNADFDLKLKVGKNEPRVNVIDIPELQEYCDPTVYCEDDDAYHSI